MKGIIVDRKGKHAVVLTGDGSFMKIGNQAHYRPGYEIEFEKPYRSGSRILAKISSIAAAFLFTLGLSYGVYSYTTPYSYVDFDINPSVELTANIYDIIIKTETFNEDGEKLLQNSNLNNRKLDEGIARLVGSAIEQGYLKTETGNTVLLTVSSKDTLKKEALEKNVENAALKALNESKVESAVISRQVSSQQHDTAKDMGISTGKLELMEKAVKAKPDLDMEALKDKPVKDIMRIIGDSRKDKKQDKNTRKLEDKEKRKQNREAKKQGRKAETYDSNAFYRWAPAQGSMQSWKIPQDKGKVQFWGMGWTQGKKQDGKEEKIEQGQAEKQEKAIIPVWGKQDKTPKQTQGNLRSGEKEQVKGKNPDKETASPKKKEQVQWKKQDAAVTNNPFKAPAVFTGWTYGQRNGGIDFAGTGYGNKPVGEDEKNQKTNKKNRDDKQVKTDKTKKGSGNQRTKNND